MSSILEIGFSLELYFLHREDKMTRDAKYFRKLQGTKSVEANIESVLNTIEQYITKGNKLQYILFTFYSCSESHCMKLVKQLKNLGFKVYNKILQTNGEFTCCIDWSE